MQQGNLLAEIQMPDPGRGGDQEFIKRSRAYEPIYNQVRSIIEARGNDLNYLPQNGGPGSPERYTTAYTFDYEESCDFTAIGVKVGRTAAEVQQLLADAGMCAVPLGDVNGDGITDQIDGNVLSIQYPTVTLLPDSNQAQVEGDTTQEIVELYTYSQFGQLTKLVDSEENVDLYEYHPENDPDGDGVDRTPGVGDGPFGYLKQVTRDAVPGLFDVNRDGGVGIFDLTLVALGFGGSAQRADMNGDGEVDTSDLRIVMQNFNSSGASMSTRYFYDPVGNIIRQVDGRGVATDYVVNELNQVVQIVRASAHGIFTPNPSEPFPLIDFQYLERTFYDFNNNIVLWQVEDRGNTREVDGNPPTGDLPSHVSNPDQAGGPAFADIVYKYDILDNEIERLAEVANGAALEFLDTRFRYDPNENLTLVIQPGGNATVSLYDERDLVFQRTRGATSPPSLALLAVGDPIGYDIRGGLPSTESYHYDQNRNLIETVDADDTDGSADNNSDLGGSGDRTRYIHDGFDRRTSIVDSVGNQTVYQYDPNGNVVRIARFGPVGGLSPTLDGPDVLGMPVSSSGVIQAPNLVNPNLLAATESLYDELNRLIQADRVLFVSTIPTVRIPDLEDGAGDIGKGDLTPGDDQAIPGIANVIIIGRVSTRTEYDRDSRRTFVVEDDRDTYSYAYDGADRVIKSIDPEGNTVEQAYDDNNNVIETRETDVSQVFGVADEVFLTTNFYDSLSRIQSNVDNLGQTFDYRYDSRDNLVAVADAQGPEGPVIGRRTFSGGTLTSIATNLFGNVTLMFYDGIDRMVSQEIILTASGQGDGVYNGADVFGVKSAIPTPDAAQGGGDGVTRTGYSYDQNSLLSSLIDDQGNVTIYLYDNLDRRVAETKGLTVNTTPLNVAKVLGPRQIVTPTVATINNPAVIVADVVNAQLAAAGARLNAVAALFPPLADRVDDVPPTTVIYGYDQDNNPLILEGENDSETFSQYDAINRRTSVRVFRSGQADTHIGDPLFAPAPVSDTSNPSGVFPAIVGTTKLDFQYDGLSRVTGAVDNNEPADSSDDSTITYAYDSLSRVVEETQQIGNLPQRIISSGWRAGNLRIGLAYPNGRAVDYTYDDLDRLNTVADRGAAQPIADYDYTGVGRVIQRSYPINGTRLTYLDDAGVADVGYDGLRRKVQIRHLDAGDSLIVGFTHSYDRMNNPLDEEKLHASGDSEVYRYDSAYRLLGFDRGSLNADRDDIVAPSPNTPLHSNWTLDGAGNWQQVDGETREHSSFNEITLRSGDTSVAIVSDVNGNETDDGTYLFEWDYRNRLRAVTRKSDGALVAGYSYDAANRRIRKVVTSSDLLDGTTDFYLAEWRVIEERDEDDTLTQQYVYGRYIDEPLVVDRDLDGDDSAIGPGDQRLFYHQNSLYSTFTLTDGSGDIVEGYQYDAYGRQTVFQPGDDGVVDFGGDDVVTFGGVSDVGNPYMFTGRRSDGEVGLYFYRSRYFNTEQGRFISRDPVGTWQDMGALGNAYTYVGGQPVNLLDPFGLNGDENNDEALLPPLMPPAVGFGIEAGAGLIFIGFEVSIDFVVLEDYVCIVVTPSLNIGPQFGASAAIGPVISSAETPEQLEGLSAGAFVSLPGKAPFGEAATADVRGGLGAYVGVGVQVNRAYAWCWPSCKSRHEPPSLPEFTPAGLAIESAGGIAGIGQGTLGVK